MGVCNREDVKDVETGGAAAAAVRRAMAAADVVLAALGPGFAADRDKLAELQTRLDEERFHLAVLGQFKRGKSSLINALLGENVLPTAVIPLTAIPTFLRGGKNRRAVVRFNGDRPEEDFAAGTSEELAAFLTRYVSDAENPKNHLGVTQVDRKSVV